MNDRGEVEIMGGLENGLITSFLDSCASNPDIPKRCWIKRNFTVLEKSSLAGDITMLMMMMMML